jgi:N-acetylmuramoyl-L-alanine amidase
MVLGISLLPTVHGATAMQRKHTKAAVDPYQAALDLRQKLEADSPDQRTKERYEEVLDAFRGVYHAKPGSSKAPAAVAAVADLLAEKGRVLKDAKALRAAIGQYEFLREQYPHSPQVDNALLLEGEICRQDLKDTACAETKFRAVIAAQTGTSFSEQAALELKEIQSGNTAIPTENNSARAEVKSGSKAAKSVLPVPDSHPDAHPAAASELASDAAMAPSSLPTSFGKSQPASDHVVMITGMRHWSNPTSTRIAIDLGGKVEYEAARVPNPDRIFFDLHGARLAPILNGHTVEVVDDGYLKRIRAAQFHPDVIRVVLDVTDVSEYSAFLLPNPWRLIIDVHSDKTAGSLTAASGNAEQNPAPPATQPATQPTTRTSNRTGTDSTIADVARLSAEPAKITATAGPTSGPVSAKVPDAVSAASATVADASPNDAQPSTSSKGRKKTKQGVATTAEADPTPHAADPTSEGQRSLVRALGLKVGRIVIDAGHGGHDSGTLGPGGIQEKDVVLDVALRVGKLLHQRLGAEIVYTRDDDTFIPLETRTAIANKAQADLFLSIHANSSPEPSARGVEAYYLNFTSDPNALDVAARENAVSNHSVHQLSDLVRKITLKDKIDESREFAADVDAGLYEGLKRGNPGLRDRGVKKAPFVVLIGAQMPSILAEISFLTNPQDAQQLRDDGYRERIAESLDAGVERYLRGLSGTGPRKSPSRSSARSATASTDQLAGR